MKGFALDSAIIDAVHSRQMRVWGTCAGAILCADEIIGETPCLSLIEASVERNRTTGQFYRRYGNPRRLRYPRTLCLYPRPRNTPRVG